MEIVAKTLITNRTDKEREIKWAGISLKAGESRAVDGFYPSACDTPASAKLMAAEIDAGKVEVTLITNLSCAGLDSVVAGKANLGKFAGQAGKVERTVITYQQLAAEHEDAEYALRIREAESRGRLLAKKPSAPSAEAAAVVAAASEDSAQIKTDSPFRRGTLDAAKPPAQLFRETTMPDSKPRVEVFGQTPKEATAALNKDKALPPMAAEAAKMVEQFQISGAQLKLVEGSGRGGKILRQDIEKLVNANAKQPVAANT